jgi:hypothetical protein
MITNIVMGVVMFAMFWHSEWKKKMVFFHLWLCFLLCPFVVIIFERKNVCFFFFRGCLANFSTKNIIFKFQAHTFKKPFYFLNFHENLHHLKKDLQKVYNYF